MSSGPTYAQLEQLRRLELELGDTTAARKFQRRIEQGRLEQK